MAFLDCVGHFLFRDSGSTRFLSWLLMLQGDGQMEGLSARVVLTTGAPPHGVFSWDDYVVGVWVS